jgi:hypothetical protein
VLLGLGLFITAGAVSQLLNPAFGIWFTEVFLFLGLGWVLLRAAGHEPLRFTGLAEGAPGPALFGFALGVANFFALVVPIQYTVQSLVPRWMLEAFDASRLFQSQTPLEMVLIVSGVSIAAPVCEEFFFRGIVQKNLLPPVLSRMGSVLVTAVIFSAFHLDPVGFLARVELGALFGLLLLRTGSLWPSILAHSANNLISTLLYLVAKEAGAMESQSETDPSAVLLLGAMGGLAMWGLLSAARRIPALWGPASEPAPVLRKPPPLPLLMLPWVVGATLALGALAVVDSRGIRLSMFDAQHPLPKVAKDAPDALHAERAALQELRARARRGEVPMQEYEEERVRQAKASAQKNEALPSP